MSDRVMGAVDKGERTGALGASDETALSGLRVMVVDDDDLVGLTAARLLLILGCVPLVFQRAEEAISEVLRHPGHVDVIVSDVDMPGASGWDLLCVLRADRGACPQVMLSSRRRFDRPVGLHEEPDGTLRKPYRLFELQTVLLAAASRCTLNVPKGLAGSPNGVTAA